GCLFACRHPMPASSVTFSLHDALPISLGVAVAVGVDGHLMSGRRGGRCRTPQLCGDGVEAPILLAVIPQQGDLVGRQVDAPGVRDRKSTRLNSSHVKISYAVFCLKKNK